MRGVAVQLVRSAAIVTGGVLVAAALYAAWQVPSVRSALPRADLLARWGVRERPGPRWLIDGPETFGRGSEGWSGRGRQGRGPGGPRLGRADEGSQPGAGPPGAPSAAPGAGEALGGRGGRQRHETSLSAGLRQLVESLAILGSLVLVVAGSRWLAVRRRRRPPSVPRTIADPDCEDAHLSA